MSTLDDMYIDELEDKIQVFEKQIKYLKHAHDAVNGLLHVHGWDWDSWRKENGYIDYKGNKA